MLKNYNNDTYLSGFVPEIAKYIWNGQTDFALIRSRAEQIVTSDFLNRGYSALALRPDLYLRDTTDVISADADGTSFEDVGTRLRLGYNILTLSAGTVVLTLQGSNDEDTWTDITTISITATGEGSILFLSAFQYYRLNTNITANTISYKAWLSESSYDLWFAFKELELILMNAGKGKDNKYTEYAQYFAEQYNLLWANGIVWQDTNGVISAEENIVRMGR